VVAAAASAVFFRGVRVESPDAAAAEPRTEAAGTGPVTARELVR